MFNRRGQFCGMCMEGYGYPVYSHFFSCLKCNATDFKYNLLKYLTVAFIPLTVFYGMVIVLKVRATSAPMVSFVLISQLLSTPYLPRFLTMSYNRPPLSLKVLISFFGIWNLDFFRSLYTPFCIHPDMTALQVLALDYLVGVYPLLLIILTYFAVLLHDRYPLIIKLWSPVNRLCMCIRKEWNIHGSLIQAFASFLVLSYVKILNISFDLLTPMFGYRVNGTQVAHGFLYFGKEHFPYGVLAAIMLIKYLTSFQ